MSLWCGADYTLLYNDAYRHIIGDKHPAALGRSGAKVWEEMWPEVESQFDGVRAGGPSVSVHEARFMMERLGGGGGEECWFTYSLTALTDDTGAYLAVVVVIADVTEHLRARAAFVSESARAESILESMADAHFTMDADFRMVTMNSAMERWLGASAADFLGRSHWEVFPNLIGTVAEANYRRVAADGVEAHWTQHYRDDVRDCVLDIDAYPAAGGGVTVFERDVTERTRAEAALCESETRFRAVHDSSPHGFALHRPIRDGARADGAIVDFEVTYINAAGARIVGLIPDKMLGHTMLELWPNTENEGVLAAYVRVMETGESHDMELLFEHPELNGSFALTIVRVDGELAITFTDATNRLRAERETTRLLAELTVERARLAYVFRHAPTFLAVLRGPEHVFELVNDSFRRLIGDRPVVGKPTRDAMPELRDQGFIEILDRVLENGLPFIGREVSVMLSRTADAPLEERFIDFVYLPLVEADGSRSGVIAHGTNVTEQVLARREIERLYVAEKEARAAVEVAYGAADAANRAKADFLATMSHELRTPLNAIGGYAELIEMGIRGPITSDQQNDLRRILVSQRHLSGLINDVLDYAKLETGTAQYDLTNVAICEELTIAESIVTPQARAKRLTLDQTDCSPLTVRADTEKLRQILINLLSNAVKFTNDGGRIAVTCATEDGFVVLRFSDNGIGIPADKLEAIFDPFVQVKPGLTRTQEGSGLGLAISRDLARGMGGDLRAESTPGMGSLFILSLPSA